ncbi:7101_t:CDS:2 [Diversispora eburnea]|uniref:7101_t:CDS:1 n=1 Tax=Diversispora eburnea TaxID=1213867 RepID=A0A9N8Z9T6_9GLOM|nr:7101_t:CDS:2 [Diversispora eburnea]
MSMQTIQNSSMDDLADLLINNLDRSKIFPPYFNKPRELINPCHGHNKTPPRPPNGFLLCRKNVHKEARSRGICNMRVISKVTGMLWRQASQDEKEHYLRQNKWF